MTIPLEFVVEGPPVSQQARNRELRRIWRQRVRRAARRRWPMEDPPSVGPVMFTIIHFYDNRMLDVDNLPKPILDALKGLVFQDDAQVTDLIC